MSLTVKRPVVRYHGGKWKLAPWVVSFFPRHRIYVEPFGGAASVLMRKERSFAEVYNDLDGEIVNLFRILRDRGDELIRLVELTPYAREEFELSYVHSDDPLEQARRTAVRCGMGFGSTAMNVNYRTGFRASTVRCGSSYPGDWKNQPHNLKAVVERLRGVFIENKDALDLIQLHDSPETLFYIDPPYVKGSRTYHRGKGGYKNEMTDSDHERLAQCLHKVRGMVVVSGYQSGLYGKLFADWPSAQKDSYADKAVPRKECLWFKITK